MRFFNMRDAKWTLWTHRAVIKPFLKFIPLNLWQPDCTWLYRWEGSKTGGFLQSILPSSKQEITSLFLWLKQIKSNRAAFCNIRTGTYMIDTCVFCNIVYQKMPWYCDSIFTSVDFLKDRWNLVTHEFVVKNPWSTTRLPIQQRLPSWHGFQADSTGLTCCAPFKTKTDTTGLQQRTPPTQHAVACVFFMHGELPAGCRWFWRARVIIVCMW